ncbi:MAG: hypothetical protein OEL75_02010, partial [Kiritimatiellaceae bacterium]|nr:hypothetical protein [Kiritimatiellaceae bacterium]
MFKKLILTILFLLSAFNLYAQEEIPWRQNITMLVVPREPLAVQVAQDIAMRYPILLVCYQQTGHSVVLHAWNGEAWVQVSGEDYINGTFFTHRPQHAVIVERDDQPAPKGLVPDGIWCEHGNRLSTTSPRAMIHLLGRHFDFPYRYWMQFSKRYNYALEEINPSLINVYWWHYRGDQVRPALAMRDFDRDMNNWHDLEITPPEPVEPVLIEAEPEFIEPAEIPAEDTTEALKSKVEEETVIPTEADVVSEPVKDLPAETVPMIESPKPEKISATESPVKKEVPAQKEALT